MNEYANLVKSNLENVVSEMDTCSYLFSKNPEKDFTRKRKLDFKKMIHSLLSMGGKTLKLELMDYFSYDTNTPTAAAFVQQRNKILPDAFQYLFHQFTKKTMSSKSYKGYRLLAADGSDICNRVFVDAHILPGRKMNERQALVDMIKRADSKEKTIVVADRGYENYSVFEHIKQKGWNYLVRIKDISSNGISSGLTLPKEDCFDKDYYLLATRRNTNEIKAHPEKYKFMPRNQKFDFLAVGSKDTYPISFRLVRFPISENTFEVLITNLDRDAFPVDKLKELYHMRWGIETSFRKLKYALGLVNLHSKKVQFIIQEIFARLIMYNFCEFITLHTVIKQKKGTKHLYQVNYTISIAICLHFFKCRGHKPPDVEALIKKNILPVRPGRKDPRKVKSKSTVSFIYRVA